MTFTPDGPAPPGIPLLGCSPPTAVRCRLVWGSLLYRRVIWEYFGIEAYRHIHVLKLTLSVCLSRSHTQTNTHIMCVRICSLYSYFCLKSGIRKITSNMLE